MSYCQIRGSIVVSISACHAEDPGSIPGRGVVCAPCWADLSAPLRRSAADCALDARHAPSGGVAGPPAALRRSRARPPRPLVHLWSRRPARGRPPAHLWPRRPARGGAGHEFRPPWRTCGPVGLPEEALISRPKAAGAPVALVRCGLRCIAQRNELLSDPR